MAWTDYSSAPAAGTPVCAEAQVEGILSLSVTTDRGSFPMLVVRVGDELLAYVNACPHQYLPLDYRGDQLVSADGTKLMCTAHGACFDIRSGDVVEGADCGLDAVPVSVRDGIIVISG
ncbi:(2Fe-2S)-binding protein [Paracoccus versutus]|uniref:Nitrite reductase/ring-hydroxylating ferredoxin subunit n=1 Tax=Paracoccus versutus TaxID=34007 RepID=A0AAQ0HGR9_PARVE|nr:Rieske 2Fe-2S domain-containing protein [Paracoccus versutus]KGJ08598.1 (2Fe-2S)-binding protein [Paracoccus versutus]REG45917.1 nitrite reductase/ring-hydroxylating ferredoxin subunit [Paracoccus versutus]WEJ77640.1 (2Fe-2S)-binding protein [Paracoccus versutus]